ncbi:hypothetical protein BJX68DRAFT_242628 [Aspergillus pseudodeflectus]|uniref:Uncharacterized protein n=1 Tax=Aspergillus pseudodeflectus TaxID=176178 RepID=A0ABR4JY22_9EURO
MLPSLVPSSLQMTDFPTHIHRTAWPEVSRIGVEGSLSTCKKRQESNSQATRHARNGNLEVGTTDERL